MAAVLWVAPGCTSTYPVAAPRPVIVSDPMDVMYGGTLVTLHGAEVVGDSVLRGRTLGASLPVVPGGWGGGTGLRDTVHIAIPVVELMVPRRKLDPAATVFTGLGVVFAVVSIVTYLECGSLGC